MAAEEYPALIRLQHANLRARRTGVRLERAEMRLAELEHRCNFFHKGVFWFYGARCRNCSGGNFKMVRKQARG
jgi:hypothetical protein